MSEYAEEEYGENYKGLALDQAESADGDGEGGAPEGDGSVAGGGFGPDGYSSGDGAEDFDPLKQDETPETPDAAPDAAAQNAPAQQQDPKAGGDKKNKKDEKFDLNYIKRNWKAIKSNQKVVAMFDAISMGIFGGSDAAMGYIPYIGWGALAIGAFKGAVLSPSKRLLALIEILIIDDGAISHMTSSLYDMVGGIVENMPKDFRTKIMEEVAKGAVKGAIRGGQK